mgnify:CR=1 FL=1
MIPAPVVDEDRLLVQPVRLHVVRQRVPHALHHIDRARLRPRLRQWDEVCDRRADIRRDHVRAHALLGLPHKVVDLLRDMLFKPSVRTGSLSCQYVRVLRQPCRHVRHSRPPILRKLIDQLLLLVRVKRVICLDRVHLLPDAFVCANENIAVGLCHQAQQEGFKIPADFCVTGFDNFDKASYYRPRITTVSYEREVIAEAAMDLLVQIWGQNTTADCKTVPVQMLFQDSCGCKPEQVRSRSEYIEDRIFQEVREIDLHNEIMELKHNLIECEDYKQMAQYFTKCVCGLRCKGVRIWMNQDLVEESLSDSTGEASYITDGYPDTMHVICEKGMEQEYSLYVYVPLHFREREVGYVVLADCDYMLENQFLFETMNTYLESLEYLYRKLRLRKANEKLSRLYVLDSLTGLYNRMAYQEFAEPLYEKCRLQKKPVTVMFIDADHLKYINDTFGHDMGNLEIRGIADGIRKVFPPEAVSMRYGGDEFVVLLPGCEKAQAESLKAAFLKALDEISKSLHAEFDVEASIGYEVVLCGEKSLNECINNADEKMYQFKKARKAQRE